MRSFTHLKLTCHDKWLYLIKILVNTQMSNFKPNHAGLGWRGPDGGGSHTIQRHEPVLREEVETGWDLSWRPRHHLQPVEGCAARVQTRPVL